PYCMHHRASTGLYTVSLHDALPISRQAVEVVARFLRYRANLRALGRGETEPVALILRGADQWLPAGSPGDFELASLASLVRDFADRKSTRLNSSHVKISYAVFCLKK